MSDAKTKKTAYIKRQTRPTLLSSMNLFRAKATYNIKSEDKRDIALYSIPAEFIPTWKTKMRITADVAVITYPMLVL